jgi:hypothetical protein
MPTDEKGAEYEEPSEVLVKRAAELCNKLATLPVADLRVLRRIWETSPLKGAEKVLADALLAEYSQQELRVALAMLDGVHQLPLVEKPLGHDATRTWPTSPSAKMPLPSPKATPPIDESPPTPSVQAASAIAEQLRAMPPDDLLWLAKHGTNPKDLRSRLIIIRNRLYRYRWTDLAAAIATLKGSLPRERPKQADLVDSILLDFGKSNSRNDS